MCCMQVTHAPNTRKITPPSIRTRGCVCRKVVRNYGFNHLANLPATVGIIRREHLLSMKSYSTFINTGRGPQLDEKDLLDMLRQRRANKVKSEMYENKIKNDNVNLVDTSEALASLKAEKNTGGDMSGQDLLAKLRQSRADKTNK